MNKHGVRFNINKRLMIILLSAGVWSLLAHGMGFFNKYSFHDDVSAFKGVGATYSSGRWMLGFLDWLVTIITGSSHESITVVNGLFTVLFIALITYMLSDALNISSNLLIVLLCGICVSFPTVTGTFGYMFTAPYYFFGTFLGVVGVYIYKKVSSIASFFLCVFLWLVLLGYTSLICLYVYGRC